MEKSVLALFLITFILISGCTQPSEPEEIIDVLDPILAPEIPMQMLIIGSTSKEVIDFLNESKDLVSYLISNAKDLEENPREQLAQFNIVFFDQSQQANKEVSRELGEAVERYVNSGGKLIVVLDSGIKRPGAFDVIGWKNTFGEVVPVSCDRIIQEVPVCLNRIFLRGQLIRQDKDHPIMKGITVFPAEPGPAATFETFDVTPTGKEIAYLKDSLTKKTYPGIVEKSTILGKSIYFNYNPGITREIFESTLKYLQ